MLSLMKSRQLHHIELSDDHNEILSHDIIKFGNKETDYKYRVRDIIYDKNANKVLLLFEKDVAQYEEEYAYWIGVLEPIN